MTVASSPREVLAFWFGPDMGMAQWFGADPAFDAQVEAVLGPVAREAAAGRCDDWQARPEGSLALVLLLDQVPRNTRRGTAAAFAQDAKARAVARSALQQGHDLAIDPSRRLFLYLPFEHSENLADQLLSEALFATFGDKDLLFYATRHREIVERFGRFPHRNTALGRGTTAAEGQFLNDPHSSF